MEREFKLLALVSAVVLSLILSVKFQTQKTPDKNQLSSSDAGFRLGYHEYGICVESKHITAGCEDYEHNATAYMEFVKGGYRHSFASRRAWELEHCQSTVKFWRKKLAERSVVCFMADRALSAVQPGQRTEIHFAWSLPLHHGWWLQVDPEIPIDWTDVNPIPD